MKNSKELVSGVLEAIKNEYPQDARIQRIMLPRLSMVSQDVTAEKKNSKTGKKEIQIITEAGTFLTEVQTDKIDPDTEKKIWEKTEIGNEIDVIILYQRKQLRYYDKSTEKFTSSPVYDTNDEVLPLFCDGKEIDRGIPADLKVKYPGVTAKGRPKSNLEETKVLYVSYKGNPYQLNLRGTSMYAFQDYARNVVPPTAVTTLNSENKDNGGITWNQMTFKVKRQLTEDEADKSLAYIRDVKSVIMAEKAQYITPAPIHLVEESEKEYTDRMKLLESF